MNRLRLGTVRAWKASNASLPAGMASARSAGTTISHSSSSSLDLDINDIAAVDTQLPPDAAVHEEAVLPSPTRREIGADFLAPDRPLDADVSLAAKRLADLRRNVDAAVHADGVEFPTEVVNGHVRLLANASHTS